MFLLTELGNKLAVVFHVWGLKTSLGEYSSQKE